MKRKGLTVFVLVVSLVFLIESIGSLVMIVSSEGISENNTTEFRATVAKIEMPNPRSGEYGRIHTEEYGTMLTLAEINRIIDIEAFKKLQAGQEVLFRIDNVWLEHFGEMDFVGIVSLKSAEEDIVSFSSYSDYMQQQRHAAIATNAVIAFLLLSAFVHCVLLLRGINVFRRFNKNKETTNMPSV